LPEPQVDNDHEMSPMLLSLHISTEDLSLQFEVRGRR